MAAAHAPAVDHGNDGDRQAADGHGETLHAVVPHGAVDPVEALHGVEIAARRERLVACARENDGARLRRGAARRPRGGHRRRRRPRVAIRVAHAHATVSRSCADAGVDPRRDRGVLHVGASARSASRLHRHGLPCRDCRSCARECQRDRPADRRSHRCRACRWATGA